MRFKLDERTYRSLSANSFGRRISTSRLSKIESLAGFPDSDIYAACQREERALVTLDLDFADVRAYPPAESPGIVVLRSKSQDIDSITRLIRKTIDFLRLQSASRQLWIATEHRVRMRA